MHLNSENSPIPLKHLKASTIFFSVMYQDSIKILIFSSRFLRCADINVSSAKRCYKVNKITDFLQPQMIKMPNKKSCPTWKQRKACTVQKWVMHTILANLMFWKCQEIPHFPEIKGIEFFLLIFSWPIILNYLRMFEINNGLQLFKLVINSQTLFFQRFFNKSCGNKYIRESYSTIS